jgi:hypothetical protein
MRRPILVLLLLTACTAPPVIDWPQTEPPETPALLPGTTLVPPGASPDPGPALDARARALRLGLGL